MLVYGAALTTSRLIGLDRVKFYLPNAADIRTIESFLNGLDPRGLDQFEFSMHDRWVYVHPAVIALTACAAEVVHMRGGVFSGHVPNVRSITYLIRMGLFDYVRLPPPIEIQAHEEAGRFIPLTRIQNSDGLKEAITNLVPLLHAPPEVADPIKYVFSEMVRNVLEHSRSPVGAFVAAQYYKDSNRVAIGIADAGIGVFEHMRQHHRVNNSKEAITLALQPGISGTTSRVGGTEFNAGAGLFFTKSIAAFSKNMFLLYSGDAAYRLMRAKPSGEVQLHADPTKDEHKFPTGLPAWPGTLIGLDINVEEGIEFATLLEQIRRSYHLDVKQKKNYAKKIKFS